MSSTRPIRRWFYAPLYVLLARYAAIWQAFKEFLPDLKVIVNGKRLLGLGVRKHTNPGKRIYMFPMDSTHMYCPHCDGQIPTHDVLLALRPEPDGCSHLFLVKMRGRVGLINERDYNPVHMRMAVPGDIPEWQERLEDWRVSRPPEREKGVILREEATH